MSAPIPNNHERVMNEDDFIVSKTDTSGKLTYVNKIFMDMAVMTEEDLLGKPHNIIRHPDMPKAVFKLLWDRIQNKEEICAYVKNLSHDGGYYWVFANITASLDNSGRIVGYYSVRRKPKTSAVDIIKPVYEEMIRLERSSGVSASSEYLTNLLKEKGVSYDELISSIQNQK
jgi:PAS domain S-box-containing protein